MATIRLFRAFAGMVIKVALHCGTVKTEYSGTWNEVLETLYYFIHLHRNLPISLFTHLKESLRERVREYKARRTF